MQTSLVLEKQEAFDDKDLFFLSGGEPSAGFKKNYSGVHFSVQSVQFTWNTRDLKLMKDLK